MSPPKILPCALASKVNIFIDGFNVFMKWMGFLLTKQKPKILLKIISWHLKANSILKLLHWIIITEMHGVIYTSKINFVQTLNVHE